MVMLMISQTIKTFHSIKPYRLVIYVSILVWFLFTLIAEVFMQYDDNVSKFDSSLSELKLKLTEHEKQIEILVSGLAQQYSTDNMKNFESFAKYAETLSLDQKFFNNISFAILTQNNQVEALELEMHEQGFESFIVSNKGIFLPSSSSGHLPISLPIVQIHPLTPYNTMYLGQNLLLSDEIFNIFQEQKTDNTSRVIFQNSGITRELVVLFTHPVYSSNPNNFTPRELASNIVGLFLLNIDYPALVKSVIKEINMVKDAQNIKFVYQQNQQTSDTVLMDSNTSNQYNQIFNIQRQINISKLRPDAMLQITYSWGFKQINYLSLIQKTLISIFIFFLILFLVVLSIRYTSALQQMNQRMREILKSSQDAVMIIDSLGIVREWNPEAERLFGYAAKKAIGKPVLELIFNHKEMKSAPLNEQHLIKVLQSPEEYRNMSSTHKVEISLHTRSGFPMLVEVTYTVLNVFDSYETSLFIKDITNQRKNEEEISQLAYNDALTGLENRVYFKREVEEFCRTEQRHFSILFIDLDGFKQVNDSLGHSVGDELLVTIAHRLEQTLRTRDRGETHLCRFGGDEFVLMIETTNEDELSSISIRILNQLELPVKTQNEEIQVSGSIGISCFPQHGQDVDTLLRHADMAMYRSKDSGKNTYSFFEEEMSRALSERLLIEKHLRNAIYQEEFKLVYQPQLDLKTGNILGVEALLRWNNPILGSVRPDIFIEIAEENRQIIPIGDWVIKQCVEQLQKWQNTEFSNMYIAFNASSVQFEHPLFLKKLTEKVQQANVNPELLEIELTERTVMSNVSENIERFNAVRENGLALSVDDFGTGYSSLSYLKRFPLNVLKIDKSFIDGLPDDDEDASIASAIIKLAHSLNINVVAEGVETFEQLQFLKELYCDSAQGYFISHPLPIIDLEEWLKSNQRNFFNSSTYKKASEKQNSPAIEVQE